MIKLQNQMENSRLHQLYRMLENEPEDDFLNHALAMELIAQGKVVKATEIMESIIRRNPSYTGTYYHLAQAYQDQKMTEKALEIVELGITISQRLGKKHHHTELRNKKNQILFEDDD